MEVKNEKVLYKMYYNSPLGRLLLVSDDESLIGLWIEGQKFYLNGITEVLVQKDTEILQKTKLWLDKYFSGEKMSPFDLAISPRGSSFRQVVWDILCKIPYGKTITYGDIAKIVADKMGRKSMSSQAVGNAVGHNPISIIIPCHRVIGKNGDLTGYAGGLERKIKLLRLENFLI